ncbi:hypothetical protein ACIFOT_22620 [Neobacillus sp. NRS-1170]|uniref:hypothetical protein n=1 Tax=Neobacillus sp. NRS-1170 TaxID=3233898 RepID=UPI003D2E8DB4
MHLNQTIDTFERSEARLTPWIFTTEEPMDDLFSITPMFPQGPLLTLSRKQLQAAFYYPAVKGVRICSTL